MLPPAGIETVAAMFPEPEAVKLVPLDPDAVQLTDPKLAGKLSLTVAPTASDGPPLLTTIVYVSDVPGTCVVFPSVFVTARSACGVKVSVSVALLFADTGSVVPEATLAEAVFESVPVAALETVPLAV